MNELETMLVNGAVVYAWLVWVFDGSIRQWVAALFPKQWLAGKPRRQIATWSATSFEAWLCLEAECPELLRKLMMCPWCSSFHISFWWVLATCLCGAPASHLPAQVFGAAGVAMFLKRIAK